MKRITILLALLVSSFGFAQQSGISIGALAPDVVQAVPSNNRSAAVDYMVDQTGTFSPIDISATGTVEILGDDEGTAAIPLGFTFNFIGNAYTEVYMSSNAYVAFDNTDLTDFSPDPIPNAITPDNYIGLWVDLDPGNAAPIGANIIRHETVGVAPNRIFVAEWFDVEQFPSGNNVTFQIHLYEGTDVIEIHTTTKPDDGSITTQGIENVGGTDGLAVPGRNGTNFVLTNDFVAFVPTGGGGGGMCDQSNVTNPGGVENGRGCSANNNWTVANDFIVTTGENAEVTSIVANILLSVGATIVSADVRLWDDAAGLPGTELDSQLAVVPTSQPLIGAAFGLDIREVTFDVAPLMMAGDLGMDVTYWISLQVTTSDGLSAFWEDQSPDVTGQFLAFENNGIGWAIPATRDGVYTYVANCTPISLDNDICANGTPIACGETLSGDTSDGNTDTNGAQYPTLLSPDEWFTFTSTTAGEIVTVSTCNQAGYDTRLSVYSDCTLTNQIAQNDDGPGCSGFTSLLQFQGDGSSTYYIAVDGFNGASGAFDLTITCELPPANDDCSGAIAISCNSQTLGTTINSTDDSAVAPDCTGPGTSNGVWYIYTDTTGLVTDINLNTCGPNTDYDTQISVYSGDCGTLTCITGNDDSPNCTNFQSEVDFQSDGNSTYYILVHGFGTATGNFELNMTCIPVPPPNDMIVNSIDVDEIGFPYTDPAVAMPAATTENGNPVGCNIDGGKGVWYNFVSAGNGTAVASITSPAGASYVTFFKAPNEMSIETDLEYFFQIGNQCAPATTANITTEAGQAYYVYVVNDGGITDIVIDGTLLGVDENIIEGFSFYPNPANDVLNLNAKNTIQEVGIYNLLGQQVIGRKVDASSSQLDISSLSTGAYLMKVTVNGQLGTYKVIKK